MNQTIQITIKNLTKYIDQIIESGSGEELHLLPELVNSLANLTAVFNKNDF